MQADCKGLKINEINWRKISKNYWFQHPKTVKSQDAEMYLFCSQTKASRSRASLCLKNINHLSDDKTVEVEIFTSTETDLPCFLPSAISITKNFLDLKRGERKEERQMYDLLPVWSAGELVIVIVMSPVTSVTLAQADQQNRSSGTSI